MVYGFAIQSGGTITIDSRLGYGTRVELVLPAATPDAGAEAPGD
jgi:signal transduction histidine kinase